MLFVQSEGTAARRRFALYLVDATDGLTAETGEAAGQPQISKNGGAFGNTTATLTAVGNGTYYVELTATELDTLGSIVVRYKSANTAEFSMPADVVAFNIHDAVPAVDVTQWLGAGISAPAISGFPMVDPWYWRGAAVATPTVAGVPEVDITHYAGSASIPVVVGGRYDVSVGAMQANVITAAATAADFSVEVNASVLAVLGALADAAADGDPTAADTLMAYVKQVVNTLVGTAGVVTYPASAVPASGASLAEAIRQIYDEVAGLNGGALPAAAPTAAAVASAVWTEPVPAAFGAGTAGNRVGTNLDATVGTRATQTSVDAIQTEVAGVNGVTPATASDVLTQVNAALDTAITVPGSGAPAASPSIRTMVAWLFKAWTRKTTQTTSQYSLYSADGSAVEQKATFADDSTTATRGPVSSGP